MTVSSSTDRATFAGNGVATAFPLPFRFFANGDIQAGLVNDVTLDITPLVLGVDYSLYGAGFPEIDGNPESILTMFVPPVIGFTLFVRRVMAVTQPTDIVNQGRFLPEIHETVFDRLTMLIQQASLSQSRAIRVQEFDPVPSALPSVSGRATKVFGFDALGNPIASSLSLAALEQQPALAAASAAAAQASAIAADSSEAAADASAALANKWATEAEDTPVIPGFFSAYHWASKALASAMAAAATLANAVLKTGAQTMVGPLTVTNGIVSIPFNKEYASPEQGIVSAGLISLSHLLGERPKLFALELVCKVAEHGYSVGDVVGIPSQSGGYSTVNHGCTVKLTPTNLDIRMGSSGTVFLVSNASGSTSAATNANWRLIVRAWA